MSAAILAKLQQGIALHQQGGLAEAEKLYEEVLRCAPTNFDALHLLGVIAFQTSRTQDAVELITKAIELNPHIATAQNNLGSATAHNNLGNALSVLKRQEQALASYDKAIALKPDYAEAHSNRGNALQELKRFDDALSSYDQGIALKPDL